MDIVIIELKPYKFAGLTDGVHYTLKLFLHLNKRIIEAFIRNGIQQILLVFKTVV